MQVQTVNHQQLIDLVKSLPSERLPSLYDFALFLKQQPLPAPLPTIDIWGETEAEIEEDEAHWDEKFAQSRDDLRKMGREAAESFRAGRAKPMTFTAEGQLKR
jgi:hypothetical protein